MGGGRQSGGVEVGGGQACGARGARREAARNWVAQVKSEHVCVLCERGLQWCIAWDSQCLAPTTPFPVVVVVGWTGREGTHFSAEKIFSRPSLSLMSHCARVGWVGGRTCVTTAHARHPQDCWGAAHLPQKRMCRLGGLGGWGGAGTWRCMGRRRQ